MVSNGIEKPSAECAKTVLVETLEIPWLAAAVSAAAAATATAAATVATMLP